MNRVYIDGAEGTTGLVIRERLHERNKTCPESEKIEIIHIPDEFRRDNGARSECINASDLTILALPDDAAREAVTLISPDNTKTRILDASTAHRVLDTWVYGLPELPGQRELIRSAKRTANPGCHATGAIMLLRPLIDAGILPSSYPVSIFSVTGYSGGGKQMIEEYENSDRNERWDLNAPRSYALQGNHKHLPEITKYSGLSFPPSLIPVVGDYRQGMQVIISLHNIEKKAALSALQAAYQGCINIDVFGESDKYESSNVNADTDKITLRALGTETGYSSNGNPASSVTLTAQFNNLGKGAAGAAIQNMNIMLGFSEFAGVILAR